MQPSLRGECGAPQGPRLRGSSRESTPRPVLRQLCVQRCSELGRPAEEEETEEETRGHAEHAVCRLPARKPGKEEERVEESDEREGGPEEDGLAQRTLRHANDIIKIFAAVVR